MCVSICVCLCVSVLQQGEPPGSTRWATARASLELGMKATGHGHGTGFLASEKPLSLGWQEEKPQEPKPPITPERQGPRRQGGSGYQGGGRVLERKHSRRWDCTSCQWPGALLSGASGLQLLSRQPAAQGLESLRTMGTWLPRQQLPGPEDQVQTVTSLGVVPQTRRMRTPGLGGSSSR